MLYGRREPGEASEEPSEGARPREAAARPDGASPSDGVPARGATDRDPQPDPDPTPRPDPAPIPNPDQPDVPDPDETPPDLPEPDEPSPDPDPRPDPPPGAPDPDEPHPDLPEPGRHPDLPEPDNDDDDDDDDDDEFDPLSPRARGADADDASMGLDRIPAWVADAAERRGVRDEPDGREGSDTPSAVGSTAVPPGVRAVLSEAGRAPTAGAAVVDPRPEGATDTEDEIFRPDLDAFSGPLELLLYLIHKDEVDIFDIPIARLLDQFLAHVRTLEGRGDLDLQEVGEYIVMAARLMEIKSRMLLPNDADEEEDLLEAEVEDPRWSLVTQLLEFRETKERAQLLEAAFRSRSQCFERLGSDIPPPEPGTLDLSETSELDLQAAFQRVLDLLRERDSVRVVPGEEIPIEVAMSQVRERLLASAGHRRAFSQLFPLELGLRGLISTFLAVLELTRLRHLRLEQPDDFGDIEVFLREAA